MVALINPLEAMSVNLQKKEKSFFTLEKGLFLIWSTIGLGCCFSESFRSKAQEFIGHPLGGITTIATLAFVPYHMLSLKHTSKSSAQKARFNTVKKELNELRAEKNLAP